MLQGDSYAYLFLKIYFLTIQLLQYAISHAYTFLRSSKIKSFKLNDIK